MNGFGFVLATIVGNKINRDIERYEVRELNWKLCILRGCFLASNRAILYLVHFLDELRLIRIEILTLSNKAKPKMIIALKRLLIHSEAPKILV